MRLQMVTGQQKEGDRNRTVEQGSSDISRRRGITWAALGGVLGPVLFAGATTVAGRLRMGYDPVAQFVSELGTGSHAWIYNGAVISFGVLELPFLSRLAGSARSARSARLVRVLFVLFCGATIVLGLVPTRHRVELGDASFIHVMAFLVGVLSLIAAIVLMAIHFTNRGQRPMAIFSGISGGVGLLLLASPLALGPVRWYAWAGLIQRLLMGVLLLWLEVSAVVAIHRAIRRGN